MAISKAFTDSQLADLISQKTMGKTYAQIAVFLEKTYGIQVSAYSVQRAYLKYQHMFDVSDSKSALKQLQEVARVKRSNSLTSRQNKKILDALNEQQDVMEQIKLAVDSLKKVSVHRIPAIKPAREKTNMTVEALYSDIHIGKLTETFNLEVCRKRLRHYTTVLIQEMHRKSAHYNVEQLIIALLGDIIENATMHGIESMRGCEFANPEQVRYAIELLMEEVMTPLAQLGLPTKVICIAGNHDRTDEKKTMQMPGKNGLSWIIYQTLKMVCDKAGFKNFEWGIPDGAYSVVDVYGNPILFEHLDLVNGNTKAAFLNHLAKRSSQVGYVLKGLRGGHYHEHCVYDNGRVVVNGSVCGGDSYADLLGFSSIASQVITYYVETKNRPSSYYHSFNVQLDHI